MTKREAYLEHKSAERLAFSYYLRTGRRLPLQAADDAVEQKFNPYHDPRNGQFTFAPGGRRSLQGNAAARRSNATSKQAPAGPNSAKASKTQSGAATKHDLGALSARYESTAGGNAGMISTPSGDRGGISYGSYQLATKTGTADAFVASPEAQRWVNEFRGLKAGTDQFSARWRAIAAREPDAFEAAQKAYIQRSLYDSAVRKVAQATGYDLNSASEAIRQVTYSTAVQHGSSGGARVMIEAVRRADQKSKRTDAAYSAALINATYDRRTEIFLAMEKRNRLAGKADHARNAHNVATGRYPKERIDTLILLIGR